MPQPDNYQLVFGSTGNPSLGGGSVAQVCTDEGAIHAFHHTPLLSLRNDEYYGQVFSHFLMNLMIYDVVGYARGEDRFIPQQLKNNFDRICSSLPIDSFNNLFLEYKDCLMSPEREKIILHLTRDSGGDETALYYRYAIRQMSAALARYKPLLAIGGAYMQLKRYAELTQAGPQGERFPESLSVLLRLAAYDMVSHNLAAGLAYQAQSMFPAEYAGVVGVAFPKSFKEVLIPKISSKLTIDRATLVKELALIEEMPKGRFLRNLTAALQQALTIQPAGNIEIGPILQTLMNKMLPMGYKELRLGEHGPGYHLVKTSPFSQCQSTARQLIQYRLMMSCAQESAQGEELGPPTLRRTISSPV